MSIFLKALSGERTERPPIWFMRQAGRSLPAYRAVRQQHSLDACFRDVERAAQITRLPQEVLGVDALILFSDILLPLEALGATVCFPEGSAPEVQAPPLSDLLEAPLQEAPFALMDAIMRQVTAPQDLPVIGFAGSPWTLLCYLLRAGKDGYAAKEFLIEQPELAQRLLEQLADLVVEVARVEVAAGASAFQVFDSCGSWISPGFAEAVVAKVHRQLVLRLSALGVPVIWLGRGSASHRQFLLQLPCALSIDWMDSISWWAHHSAQVLQGNLDPALVALDPRSCETQVQEIEQLARHRGGMILNLGHGVLPHTPVECLQRLCRRVQEGVWSSSLKKT